jgi:hypothetical protein
MNGYLIWQLCMIAIAAIYAVTAAVLTKRNKQQ